ncbi:MAG: hypothetical protein QOE90_3580 [Thermoplasmata archaeon]|nr:hypothetical protein [Thermoplasmata archaeon]
MQVPPSVAAFAKRHQAERALQPEGPLIPFLMRLHDGLPPGGVAVVADVVWQTAPTPALARAFAPAPGGEKVRPIEGWEMQAEHAGFAIVEKLDVPRAEWAPHEGPARREAIEADERGAARLVAWALRRT